MKKVIAAAAFVLFAAPPTFAQAAGPCFDNSNRYVNCGNGTVTDTVTGLIWLLQADCLPDATWAEANQAAAALSDGNCGLADGSSPGDWRLPTKAEWSATIERAVFLGCKIPGGVPPSLTNDAGTACLTVGPSSFTGVASGVYWSSASLQNDPTGAWFATLYNGFIDGSMKGHPEHVWPVRRGYGHD